MWDKVEIKRNNGGIDELKAGDVTNNIFGTEHHCLTHQPGRAPPQRSLFCWDLSCGHICSTQQHHILSWVYGVWGQRAHGQVSVVTRMTSNRREESCFPKALMIHCWPYKQLRGTIEYQCTYCMYLQYEILFTCNMQFVLTVKWWENIDLNHCSSPGWSLAQQLGILRLTH